MASLIKNNKIIRLLIKLQNFIKEKFDIVKILKKLIEYENLKELILTDNQIKIFNIMQRRILSLNILENDQSNYYKYFDFKNEMKDLNDYKYFLFDYDEEN